MPGKENSPPVLEGGNTSWMKEVDNIFGVPTWIIVPKDDMHEILATYHFRREGINTTEELNDSNTIALTIMNTEGEKHFRIDVRSEQGDKMFVFYERNLRIKADGEQKVLHLYSLGSGEAESATMISVFASGRTEPDLKEFTA
jgi:hypothetical protein